MCNIHVNSILKLLFIQILKSINDYFLNTCKYLFSYSNMCNSSCHIISIYSPDARGLLRNEENKILVYIT